MEETSTQLPLSKSSHKAHTIEGPRKSTIERLRLIARITFPISIGSPLILN